MLITVDALAATLIGQRTVRDAVRYYYTVADYLDLLLVAFDQDLAGYTGRQAVILVDTTTGSATPHSAPNWPRCANSSVGPYPAGGRIRPER